jgi:protein SCO1
MRLHVLLIMNNILGRLLVWFRSYMLAIWLIILGVFALLGMLMPAHAQHTATFTTAVRRDIKPADIPLVTSNKQSTQLKRELEAPQPQVVNFVFTTCSTICSTQTATLAVFHKKLAAQKSAAKFMSFTIDPDNDTPEQLTKFAQQFGIAKEGDWRFYTGRYDDMLKPQQAFDVYRGAKVNHPPVILMRKSASSPWVRVEGFPTPDELLQVYRSLPLS